MRFTAEKLWSFVEIDGVVVVEHEEFDSELFKTVLRNSLTDRMYDRFERGDIFELGLPKSRAKKILYEAARLELIHKTTLVTKEGKELMNQLNEETI